MEMIFFLKEINEKLKRGPSKYLKETNVKILGCNFFYMNKMTGIECHSIWQVILL